MKTLRNILLASTLLCSAAQAQVITPPITQNWVGTFWGTPAAPANIDRFADRAFFGPAVVESGQCQMCVGPSAQDWFENLQYKSYNGGAGIYSDDPFAQVIILADPYSVINTLGAPVVALVTAAETLNSNGTIRTQDITVINNAISGANPAAWGIYLEAHAVGTSHDNTFGIELEMRNSAAPTHWDPFSTPGPTAGNTPGMDLGCGAGLPALGQYPCTAAMAFGNNPMPWSSGLIFFQGSVAASAPGFTIPAIAMPNDFQIQWYAAAGVISAALTADAGSGLHILAGALYVPGSVTWASPPYGVRAYGACFNSNLTLIIC